MSIFKRVRGLVKVSQEHSPATVTAGFFLMLMWIALMSFAWQYSINVWLGVLGRETVFPYWGGLLLACIFGNWVAYVAILTFVASFFL